jgi:hypothetical protein
MANPRRFVAVADSHGDQLDPESDSALTAFMADFKPTVRIHLGDAFDFVALRNGASPEEKAVSLDNDWKVGGDFMRRFFDGGKENFFLEGNHDRVRLENFTGNHNALIRDAADDGIKKLDALYRKCRCKSFPYDSRLGVLRLGDLKCIHGYACGVGATAKHARVYGNVIHGHTHVIECVAVESDLGSKEARAIGAMCRIDMPYNSRQMNKLRHANGFAYGFLFESGEYQIFQARKIDGRFYAATDIRTF